MIFSRTYVDNMEVFYEKWYNRIKPMDFVLQFNRIEFRNSESNGYVILGVNHIKTDDSPNILDMDNFTNYMKIMNPNNTVTLIPFNEEDSDKLYISIPIDDAAELLSTQFRLQIVMFNDNKFISKIHLTAEEKAKVLSRTRESISELSNCVDKIAKLPMIKSRYLSKDTKFITNILGCNEIIDDKIPAKVKYNKLIMVELPEQLIEIINKYRKNHYKPDYIFGSYSIDYNNESVVLKTITFPLSDPIDIDEIIDLVGVVNSSFIVGGCFAKITYECDNSIRINCSPEAALYILLTFIRIHRYNCRSVMMIEDIIKIIKAFPYLNNIIDK